MKGLTLTVTTSTPAGVGVAAVLEHGVVEFEGGLDELQRAVGGNVEVIPSHHSVTFWVNEDGKFTGLPINRLAMDAWLRWDEYGCMLFNRDWIAGSVVVTGGVGRDGETKDLPESARRWVLAVARDAGAVIS